VQRHIERHHSISRCQIGIAHIRSFALEAKEMAYRINYRKTRGTCARDGDRKKRNTYYRNDCECEKRTAKWSLAVGHY
jgi:hypothetical protein